MTALTLQVICKNPPVNLHKIDKFFSKISRTSLIHGHIELPQNLQEAAATICSKKVGCPS